MMKMKVLILFLLIITAPVPLNIQAMTIHELPSKQSSNQWLITVDKADENGPQINYSRREPYHTYSMSIKNIGRNVAHVRVQAFRNELNSNTMHGLFAPVEPPQILKRGKSFQFANFPITNKATELKIVVTWNLKGSRKEFMETFVFREES